MAAIEGASEAGLPPPHGVRARLHAILGGTEASGRSGRGVAIGLTILILANVLAAALQTVEALHAEWHEVFDTFEAVSVGVFTIEYALRLWACTADPRHRHPFWGRIRFALTPLMLVDLLAIAPFFLTSVVVLDLRTLRSLRLIRLLRVLKIARYSESLQLLGRVLLAKRGELLVTLAGALVLLVISSTLMYYAEHDAQPRLFASVPAAMWWGIQTLTTIGYGDMTPVTVAGRVISSFIALLGIGLFALPAGILGSGFIEEMQRKRAAPAVCPHCGGPLGT